MLRKSSFFTAAAVAAFAAAGAVGLSTCARNKRVSPVSQAPAEKPAGHEKGTPPEKPGPAKATGQAPVLDERVAAVMADAVAKWDQLQGVTATLKTQLNQGAGGPGSTEGAGTYDCQKRDGKLLISLWITNTLRIYKDDRVITTGEVIWDYYDGEYLFKQLQQTNLRQVTKRFYTPGGILQIGGRELFRSLSEGYALRTAGEQSVNERQAYVIEAAPAEGGWKTRHYFDKETGIRVKLVELDEAGEQALSIELSELKLNPEFGEDTFRYTMPPGFTMIDETAGQP